MLEKKEFYKKRAVLFFTIFSLVAAGLIGTALYLREQNLDKRSKAYEETKETSIKEEIKKKENLPPKVINIPSNMANVSQTYSYPVKVYDPDTPSSEINISLENYPEWIEINNGIISGTPTSKDIGTYKIKIVISDGENKIFSEYYLKVK